MKNIRTENGDMVFENRDLSLVDSEAEFIQTVKELFSVNRKEWFFNEDKGFDFFQVLGRTFDEELARSAVLDVAVQEPRIEDITNIEFEQSGRSLVIKMQVNGQEVTVDAPQ